MVDVIRSMFVQVKVNAVLAPSCVAEQGSAVDHLRRRVVVLYWQVAGDEFFARVPVHGYRPGARIAAAFSMCVLDCPVWLGNCGWESTSSRCGEEDDLSCDRDVHIESGGVVLFGYRVVG